MDLAVVRVPRQQKLSPLDQYITVFQNSVTFWKKKLLTVCRCYNSTYPCRTDNMPVYNSTYPCRTDNMPVYNSTYPCRTDNTALTRVQMAKPEWRWLVWLSSRASQCHGATITLQFVAFLLFVFFCTIKPEETLSVAVGFRIWQAGNDRVT
jgi:hypothetical protein